MNYLKRSWQLFDNYVLARWQNRPSTALFWYLPETPNIKSKADLERYQTSPRSPLYLIDYRHKLNYLLENESGIIILPYNAPVGRQINPEAAFQYALGLHDEYCLTSAQQFGDRFLSYANYFLAKQTPEGLWSYDFDWYGSSAPWHSALAQSRGASVFLRAWLHTQDKKYLTAAQNALKLFNIPTQAGGFLHEFKPANCTYFEEYPHTPTAVLNGMMAALLGIWEVSFWTKEASAKDLWQQGLSALETMLPFYSNGWWSLYDIDVKTPIQNVNSPRYHLLEINYLQILSLLSDSAILSAEREKRIAQYQRYLSRLKALSLKSVRKIIYK